MKTLVTKSTFRAAGLVASACADDALFQPHDSLDAIAVASQTATAGEATPKDRPFHGNTIGQAVGQVVPAPEGRCPMELPILFLYRGAGRATHLGTFTVEGSECVFMDPSNPASLTSGAARFVFTAANGDELHVAYDHATIGFEPPPSPWITWSASAYATGGTGRFANAELVEVTWQGGGNLVTMETYSSFDGWIRYQASDRAKGF